MIDRARDIYAILDAVEQVPGVAADPALSQDLRALRAWAPNAFAAIDGRDRELDNVRMDARDKEDEIENLEDLLERRNARLRLIAKVCKPVVESLRTRDTTDARVQAAELCKALVYGWDASVQTHVLERAAAEGKVPADFVLPEPGAFGDDGKDFEL